jgi:hypothetical protein
VFTVSQRDHVREWVFTRAAADQRIVAGAVVGSLAKDKGDRWSDLDLMLGVADDVAVPDVLESWSQAIIDEFDAVHLFDLASESVIYRVFLLPHCLELDLSFTPASEFAPAGPDVDVAFGEVVERQEDAPTSARELLGYAVHHVLHARAAIERGHHWKAEYWISAVRDHALHLACLRRGLDGWYARDFDRLPADVLEPCNAALVRSLDTHELNRALASAVAALLLEDAEVEDMIRRFRTQLRELAQLPHVPPATDSAATD